MSAELQAGVPGLGLDSGFSLQVLHSTQQESILFPLHSSRKQPTKHSRGILGETSQTSSRVTVGMPCSRSRRRAGRLLSCVVGARLSRSQMGGRGPGPGGQRRGGAGGWATPGVRADRGAGLRRSAAAGPRVGSGPALETGALPGAGAASRRPRLSPRTPLPPYPASSTPAARALQDVLRLKSQNEKGRSTRESPPTKRKRNFPGCLTSGASRGAPGSRGSAPRTPPLPGAHLGSGPGPRPAAP